MEIVKTQNLEKLNQNIKDDFFKVPNLKFDIEKLKADLNIVLKKKKFNTLGIKNFGAPKFLIPRVLNFFFFNTMFKSAFNFSISNFKFGTLKKSSFIF